MTPYYPSDSDSDSLSDEEIYARDNKIYVLGKTFIQGFSTDGGGHTIAKQKLYKTNMTEPNKNLFYHYTTIMIILIYLLMVLNN